MGFISSFSALRKKVTLFFGAFFCFKGGADKDNVDSIQEDNADSKQEARSNSVLDLPQDVLDSVAARLSMVDYVKLKWVCRYWKEKNKGNRVSLRGMRKELEKLEECIYLGLKDAGGEFLFYALYPFTNKWQRLPPISGAQGWLMRKPMHLFGSTFVVFDGYLYMIGGCYGSMAVKCVWRYCPFLNSWWKVRSMSCARAFSRAAVLNNRIYVVGGVGKNPPLGGFQPLLSAEVLDPETGTWSLIQELPYANANFVINGLGKPMATGMVAYKGKLLVTLSLYMCPLFTTIGAYGYDPETNAWESMSDQMNAGWPVEQARTELCVVVEGVLYGLLFSRSLDKATIMAYDDENDAWNVVVQDVSVNNSTNPDCQCLLVGSSRRLYFIAQDSSHNIKLLEAMSMKVIATWNFGLTELVTSHAVVI